MKINAKFNLVGWIFNIIGVLFYFIAWLSGSIDAVIRILNLGLICFVFGMLCCGTSLLLKNK